MKMLEVNNLQTCFHTRQGVVRAVDGVSFSLAQGETLGIVGESGAGKSITGFSIIRMIEAPGSIDGGEVIFQGDNLLAMTEHQLATIRGGQISMIFQDPQTSLNPVLTIGYQLIETIRIHNPDVDKKQAHGRAVEILRIVGIPAPERRIGSYPHQLSGGMKQRVVIAMALVNNPQLLIADEPTTALDVTIQAQILSLMKKLNRDFNASLILITHDISVVALMCDKVAVMYAGKIVEYGSKKDILYAPLHPYTQGLIRCLPALNDSQNKLYQIPGIMPSLLNLPEGCHFRTRCFLADDECLAPPQQRRVGNRYVSCHKCK
jgi:oligopeptide/dipeptide ABC transporter ATP-binding protein